MARTLALLNNKGGTGKTTTTLGLGVALARRRQRVLLIDLDSQRNLSAAFTLPEGYTGIGRALVDSLPLHEAMVKVDKQLWVLGSTPALAGVHTARGLGAAAERIRLHPAGLRS